jgi:hypothetical protein
LKKFLERECETTIKIMNIPDTSECSSYLHPANVNERCQTCLPPFIGDIELNVVVQAAVYLEIPKVVSSILEAIQESERYGGI